jgi:urate oxidase
MTGDPYPRPGFRLGPNNYGKSGVRVVRVGRETDRHELRDLTVHTALTGDFEATHYRGDNAGVLPTDTQKNTVYAFAREGIGAVESFAERLARHFVAGTPSVTTACVQVEEHAWARVGEHSFARGEGGELRTTEVVYDGRTVRTVSGVRDLLLLNTTDSAFRGFLVDEYTTLPETDDRILATAVTATWEYESRAGQSAEADGGVKGDAEDDGASRDGAAYGGATTDGATKGGAVYDSATDDGAISGSAASDGAAYGGATGSSAIRDGATSGGAAYDSATSDGAAYSGATSSSATSDGAAYSGATYDDGAFYDRAFASARKALLEAFADTYSLSLQQTLYAVGERILKAIPEVAQVRLSLPNRHHYLFDLGRFGLDNPGVVFQAGDLPYGLIEGTVRREQA